MSDFSHVLDNSISRLQPLIMLAVLVAWGTALIGHISARRTGSRTSPKFIIGSLVFGGLIAGEFAVAAVIKRAALQEIRPKLFANIENVTVNGTGVSESANLIGALRSMHDMQAHHSHPTVRYEILLSTSQGPLMLVLCRDSQDHHEYWVYYPGFRSTECNEVGRVLTDALDNM